MALDNHLVIMAKAPKIGQVKSRLANQIGAFAAYKFYYDTMKNTIFKLSDSRWTISIAITPDLVLKSKKPWKGAKNLISQGGGSLGKRMEKIMSAMPRGPKVIVGTDIPHIQKKHIERAFAALNFSDAVFGPSFDGGFWLVGLKRRPKVIKLFANVRWSNKNTLKDTIKNLPPEATFLLLDKLIDVDDLNSLNRAQKIKI